MDILLQQIAESCTV